MVHRGERLTPLTRQELVQQIAEGWPVAEVARQFRVSRSNGTRLHGGLGVTLLSRDRRGASPQEWARRRPHTAG